MGFSQVIAIIIIFIVVLNRTNYSYGSIGPQKVTLTCFECSNSEERCRHNYYDNRHLQQHQTDIVTLKSVPENETFSGNETVLGGRTPGIVKCLSGSCFTKFRDGGSSQAFEKGCDIKATHKWGCDYQYNEDDHDSFVLCYCSKDNCNRSNNKTHYSSSTPKTNSSNCLFCTFFMTLLNVFLK